MNDIKKLSLEEFITIFEEEKERKGIEEKELSEEENKYLYFIINMFKIDTEFRNVIMDVTHGFTLAH